MCGIAGWIEKDSKMIDRINTLNEMSKTLERRGPDENGIYVNDGTALIHRRLAVIDRENGKQPMAVSHDGVTYVIVYNGELYNAPELREELKANGFHFRGHSDTEVVLKTCVLYGEAAPEKLNGIFAFALYRSDDKSVFLCRDRIGVKPLFYSEYNNGIVFGSEIKALLASGVVKPQIDEQGLNEIFFLGPARTPSCGVFKGVHELNPGECAVYKGGRLRRRTYFSLEAHEHGDNEKQTIENTRYLLTDAIERQLVSDVPMCFFLSGGLDSSIIVKTAAEYRRAHKLGRVDSFSVEYSGNRKYFRKSKFQPTPDYDFIRLMAKNAGARHNEVVLDNAMLADALYDSVKARDLPGYVDVDSSLLLFCRELKNDFTVALSGECADELFGGYPWYFNEEILFEDCFPWSPSLDIRRSVLKSGVLKNGEEYARQRYLDTISAVPKLKGESRLESRMREMFALNFYWFMQCLLERKDRCSMYSGFEVRVPFCDYRLVDYAFNMPWNLKAYGGREKGIVRKAFEDILPKEIVWRKKSPYPKTHNPEYFNICAERVKIILKKKNQLTELLNTNQIELIIENPSSVKTPWYGQLMQAPQILAYIIELDYLFEKYKVEII
ncbi:MAG TPA: asparagine synthase (glutamine-hydrolyzing) [Ruminococcaceae bacterium]|nr:asparagine synthase (glutamine-hydrolyzing) [Oscillospiraceae bacterium]